MFGRDIVKFFLMSRDDVIHDTRNLCITSYGEFGRAHV